MATKKLSEEDLLKELEIFKKTIEKESSNTEEEKKEDKKEEKKEEKKEVKSYNVPLPGDVIRKKQTTKVISAAPTFNPPPTQVEYNFITPPTYTPAQYAQYNQPSSKKRKKMLRYAAGETWEDPSLADWPENDYRIFVGDLGNDVTDDMLARAFKHYRSFAKAKVIRDKYTSKTKGYGFVSLTDPNDFLDAMTNMNGKYIGNRPCRLLKSKWQERNAPNKKQKIK